MVMIKDKYNDISKSGKNLKNIDTIIDSINNIINTRIGERPFKRDFGSRIQDYLFRPLSFSVSRSILSELISCITKWEKRVEVLNTTEVVIDPDNRRYYMTLNIRIPELNTEYELTRSLYIKDRSL